MDLQEIEAGSKFGPYTIEGLIAGGGMGSVYAARHAVYGSPVALKILHADLHRDAEWRERFSKEGLVGVQLKHPHILSARDLVMEDDGRVALVLDLVQEGKTLLRVMSRQFSEGLPLVQALQLLLGLIQGVEYAHEKGVVHGDIKPENVMIHGDFRDARTWVPKLTDFGTVAIIAHPVTVDGQPAVVVSPRYASPEHVLGMDCLEPRSDIYCLGLLLHYLLTATHASNAATVADAARAVARQVPIGGIVDQPDSVIRIFQQATRLDPEERFASCRDFALAIRETLDSLGAELEVDDLQADLVTEVMEERRKEKRAMLADRLADREEPTGPTEMLEEGHEEGSMGKNAEENLAHEAFDEEVDDQDTADQVSPFSFQSTTTNDHMATEVPNEREYEPIVPTATPAPVNHHRPERDSGSMSPAVWLSVIGGVLVVVAVLLMNR